MKKGIACAVICIMLYSAGLVACSGSGSSGSSVSSNPTSTNGNTGVGNGSGGGTNYYPVALGDRWRYANTTVSGGNSYNSTYTTEIIQKTDNSYSAKSTYSNMTDYSVVEYVLTANIWGMSKVTSYGGNGTAYTECTYSPPAPIHTLNAAIGAHQATSSTMTCTSSAGSSSSNMQTDYTVVGIESVNVSAGSFNNALKISSDQGTHTAYSWYAPGVGLIKYSGSWSTGSTTVELTSYTVH